MSLWDNEYVLIKTGLRTTDLYRKTMEWCYFFKYTPQSNKWRIARSCSTCIGLRGKC